MLSASEMRLKLEQINEKRFRLCVSEGVFDSFCGPIPMHLSNEYRDLQKKLVHHLTKNSNSPAWWYIQFDRAKAPLSNCIIDFLWESLILIK